jgi:hypothetical protein
VSTEPTTTAVVITWPATADDVAALLRARTQDNTDVEVGQWTATTRPTLAEVERILSMCQPMVLGQTGRLENLVCDTADDVRAQAATAVALLGAMFVELSYFPEQVASNRSAYDQYAALWQTMMPQLVASVAECVAGAVEPDPGAGADGAVSVPAASWGFPVDAGGMVGWQTRW